MIGDEATRQASKEEHASNATRASNNRVDEHLMKHVKQEMRGETNRKAQASIKR